MAEAKRGQTALQEAAFSTAPQQRLLNSRFFGNFAFVE